MERTASDATATMAPHASSLAGAVTLRNAPAVPNDRIEPADPMERIDPAEPIESTEPAEPIDKAEPEEASDQADANDRTDRWLNALRTDLLDQYEAMPAR